MNLQPWLEIILVLGGSIFGSYLAVRVELATIKAQIAAQRERFSEQLADHARRIERLEGEYFRMGD